MFLKYGIDVLNFIGTNQVDQTNPMIMLFPRMTKCTYKCEG